MQNGKNNGSDLVAKNAIVLNPTKRNQDGKRFNDCPGFFMRIRFLS